MHDHDRYTGVTFISNTIPADFAREIDRSVRENLSLGLKIQNVSFSTAPLGVGIVLHSVLIIWLSD